MAKNACVSTVTVGYIPRSIIFTDWNFRRNRREHKIFKGRMLRLYRTDKWPIKEIMKDLTNWKTQNKYKQDMRNEFDIMAIMKNTRNKTDFRKCKTKILP